MDINKIYEGDSLEILKTLPNESVDCCVCSPPYWALRDYGVEGQLGLEPNFNDYINKLCNIFDEVKRVLKREGTCWINIGDTYYTKSGTGFVNDNLNKKSEEEVSNSTGINKANEIRGLGLLQEKSLCNIPARFSIEMQNRGWILRNEIIWYKSSCMPSSANDRFTVDFEKVFFFVKQRRYYFNQQFEPLKEVSINRAKYGSFSKKSDTGIYGGLDLENVKNYSAKVLSPDYPGRNMRTTWFINYEANHEEHYATYPQKLIHTPISAGCPENGIVLDPFFGLGTTGLVARKLGRNYIGIELNSKYIKIAERRIYNEIGLFL
jgi:DNA modification methylase